MRRYKIPTDTFQHTITCAKEYDYVLSPNAVDAIYTIALSSDKAVRDAFADVLGKMPIKLLSDAEIQKIASESATAEIAFEKIFDTYDGAIDKIASNGPYRAVAALYENLDTAGQNGASTSDDAGPPEVPSPGRGLPADVTRRIAEANRSVAPALASPALSQNIPQIKKSSVDDVVRNVEALRGQVYDYITDYYKAGLSTAVRDALSRAFADQGLAAGKEANRKIVFDQINRFSWKNYVVSILVRLMPVFLFGLIIGAIAGRAELFSIALAGGLAAFLLSWPLMLVWDRLVQGIWSDKRSLFFSLYAIYIVSFFFTARSAALLGAWLRERRMLSLAAHSVEGVGLGPRVTWREVAINVGGAIILNGLAYAWNLFLPITISLPASAHP